MQGRFSENLELFANKQQTFLNEVWQHLFYFSFELSSLQSCSLTGRLCTDRHHIWLSSLVFVGM